MTKLALVTEEEFSALQAKVGELQAAVESLRAGKRAVARDYLTPQEVARRHGVRKARVFAALSDGHLRAEKRPQRGRACYRILPDDARAWYDRFVRAKDNQ